MEFSALRRTLKELLCYFHPYSILKEPNSRAGVGGATPVTNWKDTQIWGVYGCFAPIHTPNLVDFPVEGERP